MVRVDEETNLGVAIVDRLQRAVRQARPVPGRPARVGRVVPQRRRVGCPTVGRHRLPQLRVAGGPRRDVAVRRGDPWDWPPAAASSGMPVTGGNVSFYNQTGDAAILPTPVVGVLGVIDDVTRRTPIGFVGRGSPDLPARHDGATSSTGPSGRTWSTATSADGLRAWTWQPSERWPRSWSTRPALGTSRQRTTCPMAASPRRSSSRVCVAASARRSDSQSTSTRSSRCSASRPRGRSWQSPRRPRTRSPTCAQREACRSRASA